MPQRAATTGFLAGLLLSAAAGAAPWTAAGPDGADVRSLAFDPRTGVLLAGTADTGVFRSVDGAQRWSRTAAGLAPSEVHSVAFDGGGAARAWAATPRGLFTSSDGGFVWHATALALPVDRIVVAPSRPARLYAATYDPLQGDHRLAVSDDRGAHWRMSTFGDRTPATIDGLFVDPRDPDRLFAVADWTLLRSTDGGRHWEDRTPLLPARVVQAFAVDPLAPDILYLGALLPERGIFRSLDGGRTWKRLSFPEAPSFPVLLAATPGGEVYAEFLLSPEAGSALRLYRSTDRGRSWRREQIPEDVHQILTDPAHRNRVWAAGWTGVLRRQPGTGTWTAAIGGLRAASVSSLTVDTHGSATLYAGATIGGSEGERSLGVYRSLDGGTTWQRRGAPLRDGLEILALAADPTRPGVLYASDSGAPRRSGDGGAHWRRLAMPPEILIQAFAVAPDGAHVLAAGMHPYYCSGLGCPHPPPNPRLVESRDGGVSWEDVTSRLLAPDSAGTFAIVRVDAADPRRLVVGGDQSFVSTDGGAHWSEMPVGAAVADLALDPAHPGVLFAGTRTGGRVLRSGDGGSTWTDAAPGLPPTPATLPVELALAPGTGTLYAAVSGRVFALAPGAASWRPVPGLSAGRIRSLLFDSASGRLYAGAADPGGLFVTHP